MKNYKKIIGENLAKLRADRKLSLDKVADLTGISKSMLSQIEKGTANPSISTLWKLANGFKISFTELLNTPEGELELIQLSKKDPLVESGGCYRNYPIVLFDSVRRFETYQIEMDLGAYLEAEAHPEGTQEYISVMEGNMTIILNKEKHHLVKGDTLRFKADIPHIYQNDTCDICTLHMILYYPEK